MRRSWGWAATSPEAVVARKQGRAERRNPACAPTGIEYVRAVPHADEGILREVLDLSRSADTAVGGTEQLFAALYDELHRLAERQLRAAGGDSTLSATTLLHEAYLDMAGRDGVHFPDRARFMGYAARAMRGIVIDRARQGRASKRGGGVFVITLDVGRHEPPDPSLIDPTDAFEALSSAR
jgi:DNA-directed RNA polymerase specialized sigma24 family protein